MRKPALRALTAHCRPTIRFFRRCQRNGFLFSWSGRRVIRFRFETSATRQIGSVVCVRSSETSCEGSTGCECDWFRCVRCLARVLPCPAVLFSFRHALHRARCLEASHPPTPLLTPARCRRKIAPRRSAAHSKTSRRTRVLVDHRYYRVKPGTTNAHLDLYEKHGFLPQTRHLGQPFAYLYTESGEIN